MMFDDATIARNVKAALRKRMRGLRNTMPAAACATRSEAIAGALDALPELAAARHVALFHPIEERHEVDLRPFDAALRTRGVSVYYPAIDPDSRIMSFRFVDDLETLEERGLGFREPADSAPLAAQLDVIVVPCLAADPSGHRLGYGAGFYDRALPLHPAAWTVAVAYDFQLLVEIPRQPLDVPVRALVTDVRTLRVV